MLRYRFILLLAFCGLATLQNAQTTRTLKPILELQMPEGSGSNGGGVAWHVEQKKYYAAFAGNADFPLTVFDKTGKRLSGEGLTTGFDVRGIWYDPIEKGIFGNAYGESGWFMLNLDESGIPVASDNVIDEMIQPDNNSVGFVSICKDAICFLNGQEVKVYKNQEEVMDENLRLYAGLSKKPKVVKENEDTDKYNMPENYNSNVAVCTELPKAEFGLLNISTKQIELYDKTTGLMTQILKLPTNAPTNNVFNFSFANGIYWLFDKEKRKWVGYK